MFKLSLVIPVYNAVEDVKVLFSSIIDNFDFNTGEIIVIDDCSMSETADYLNSFISKRLKFKLLTNKENLGFIKTCNRAMKEAKGEVIVLLNSDTEIPPGFCKKIVDCFASDNKIGIASPISSHSALYTIEMPKGYSVRKMNKLLEKKHKTAYPLIKAAEGFCFCIRKEVINMQGYFDEIYGRGYYEETDYAYKAISNGWKNVLIDNLYVYHKRNASFGTEERNNLMETNAKIFYKRWAVFRDKYIRENKIINPMEKIYKELFPLKSFYESIMKKLNKNQKTAVKK